MPEQVCCPRKILQKVFTTGRFGCDVYLSQNQTSPLSGKNIRILQTGAQITYFPLCDDFGPMNMSSAIRFIEMLDQEASSLPSYKLIYRVEAGRRPLTNAIFLLGSYMIFRLNMTAQQVTKQFGWLDPRSIEPYRDATFDVPTFQLQLYDCWRGLEQGKANSWISLPSNLPRVWGMIDVDYYEHYDSPEQGDLHEVIPGKFVAFKGPEDLGGRLFFDDEKGYRHFSPAHYAPILKELGVTSVIRLNESQYDASVFTDAGISHFDLEFPDCTPPPPEVVQEFFKIVDTSAGAIAVHCKAGLGRTGTLIALYMMRDHGFTARDAIGWLRVMRPGSVIGEQQHFLHEVERTVSRVLSGKDSSKPAAVATTSAVRPAKAQAAGLSSAELAAQVSNGMARRGSTRMQAADHAALLSSLRNVGIS